MELFMRLALCRCETSKPVDIVFYFKSLATKQMHKDNCKQDPNLGNYKTTTSLVKSLVINDL